MNILCKEMAHIVKSPRHALWAAVTAVFLAVAVTACSVKQSSVELSSPTQSELPGSTALIPEADLEQSGSIFDAAALENQPGTLPYTPDLNHNGIPETLVRVVEEDDRGRIEVWEGDKLLWPKSTSSELYGQRSLFLCTLDGEDYLLDYNPRIGRWYAGYDYQLIDVKYSAKPLQENSVSFDLNYGASHQSFDPAEIAAFMEELNGLLENCVPLWVTYPELSDTFVKESRLVDTLWWLDYFPETFTRDENATLLENLKRFQSVRFQEVPEPEPVSWESAEDAKVAYWAVIEDGGSFFNIASGKYQDLTRWYEEWDGMIKSARVQGYTCIDLDSDGTPEIIISVYGVGAGTFGSGYIVLHYQDGMVYGFQLSNRSLMQLKADGTFRFSSGAFDNGIGRIGFTKTDEYPTLEIEKIAYSESGHGNDENGERIVYYYIDGECGATYEESETFCEPYRESANAVWYDVN